MNSVGSAGNFERFKKTFSLKQSILIAMMFISINEAKLNKVTKLHFMFIGLRILVIVEE